MMDSRSCVLQAADQDLDTLLLLAAQPLCEANKNRGEVKTLRDVEFRVFSQWGDDGIIQWLVSKVPIAHKTFVEFGVQDYRESNTRFLLLHDNWDGLVMDGSKAHVEAITRAWWFWRQSLCARHVFLTRENVETEIQASGFPTDLGLLHIDVDGNDYWLWEALHVVSPRIMIIEYNSVFGGSRPIATPYDPAFVRTDAHHSNLYFGASLAALCHIAAKKGYAFVGSNSAGNNAYFVRRDVLPVDVPERICSEGYVESRFRESRDSAGNLTWLRGADRLKAIRGLPVVNVITNITEEL